MRCLQPVALLAALAAVPPAGAAEGVRWDVRGDFDNNDAARNLSGAACTGPDWCLAVNDEENYAQVFRLRDGELDPGARLLLLEGAGEADIEAAAHADGWIYAAGSHGAPRQGGPVEAPRFFLYRFPVDPADGAPRFAPDRDRVAPEIARTGRLRDLIRADPALAPFAEAPLEAGGVTIEGLAVAGGRAFFGFRAPVLADGAVILEADVEALFVGGDAGAVSHRAELGLGYGIRDMAVLGGGFLLLAGAATEPEMPPAVWLWAPGQAARLLAVLEAPPGWKAEGLLVLGPPEGGAVPVLVLFDGEKDGAPVAYRVPLP